MDLDEASTSAQKRITVVSDFLGITNLKSEGAGRVDKIVRKTIVNLINNSRKWCENAGRIRLTEADVAACIEDLPPFVQKAVTASSLKSADLVPLSHSSQKINVFAHPGAEGEVSQLNGSLPKVPVENRLKGYFIVIDGTLVETPYNFCKSWKIDNDGSDEKAMKEEKRKVARYHKSTTAPTASKLFQDGLRNARAEQVVALKPQVPEILSLEQQTFLKDIMTVVYCCDDKRRSEGLSVIESDAGLQDLLPYLVGMISRSIAANIVQKCLSVSIYTSRIIRSLINNKQLNLTPVLHILIPTTLSCVLTRQLSVRDNDNHWALRDYAVVSVSRLIKEHAHQGQQDFRTRVFNFALKVLTDRTSSRPMIFGAVSLVAEYVPNDRILEIKKIVTDLIRKTSSQQREDDHVIVKQSFEKTLHALTKADANLNQRLSNLQEERPKKDSIKQSVKA